MLRNSIKAGTGLAWLLLAVSLAVAYRAQAAEPTAQEKAARTGADAAQVHEEMAQAEAEEQTAGRQAELEAQLAEAQSRLEQAAREVAELSARLSGDGLYFSIRGLEDIGPRPMLGVNIGRNVGADAPGVQIVGVTPDGPADDAGLRSGDVMLAIDDEDLVGANGGERLTAYMKNVRAGQEVRVRYRRDGNEMTTTVVPEQMDPMRLVVGAPGGAWEFDLDDVEQLRKLEELESLSEMDNGADFHFAIGFPGRWGDLEMVSLTPELGDYFDAASGLLVVRAPDDDTLGLQDGDVILAIDGRQPTSPRHAMRILRSYEPGETINFSIVRKKKRQTLEVSLPRREAMGRHPAWPPIPPPPAPARSPAPTGRPGPTGT